MDSLLRITKASKGITIIPYLASIDLPDSERSNLIEFMDPVPVRSVGLLTHKHFVKKRLLTKLETTIQQSIRGLIPENEHYTVVRPL